MRRTSCTLQWNIKRWADCAGGWSGLPLDIAEGVRAYALRQADVHRSIRDSFQEMWNRPLNPPVSKEETGEDGPEPFVDPMLESIVESHEDD